MYSYMFYSINKGILDIQFRIGQKGAGDFILKPHVGDSMPRIMDKQMADTVLGKSILERGYD